MSTKKQRPFLVSKGNGKMGRMLIFSIPAGDSCPGKSELCFEHCYARKNHFTRPAVIGAYVENWKAAEKDDFVDLMVEHIKQQDEKLMRLHAAGDFYSAEYVKKWIAIIKACPEVNFYAYTRSWRVPSIYKALLAFAKLPNAKLWFSVDQETGLPKRKPQNVRFAYMQIRNKDRNEEDLPPSSCDLVFRDHVLRKQVIKKINDVMVCPHENGVTELTCEQCKFCYTNDTKERQTLISLRVVA